MKISFLLLDNPEIVKKTISLDDLSEYLIHENIETWEPNLSLTTYLTTFVNDMPYGLIAFERFCSNSLIFHGGVFKINRGKDTHVYLKQIVKELKNLTKKEILTTIPTWNKKVIKLVKKIGFKEKCIVRNASVKGDMVLLSENK